MSTLSRIGAAIVAATLVACGNDPEPIVSAPPIEHRALGNFTMPVWQVAFSPDGRLLAATGAEGAVALWRWPEGTRQPGLIHAGGATGLAFSPDGKRIATSGYDAAVRVWSITTGAQEVAMVGHTGTIWSVAWSPDGKRIASSGEDRTVRIWDAADGHLVKTIDAHERIVWSVRFTPDGRRIVSGSFDTLAKAWSVPEGELVNTLKAHTEAIVEVAASADGNWIATAGDDSRVRLWRAGLAAPEITLDARQHQYAVTFSPDSRLVAAGGREKGTLGTLVKNFVGRAGMKQDATVRIWRVEDGALLALLDRSADDVHSVAFSPDGEWLAASGEGPVVDVYKLRRLGG